MSDDAPMKARQFMRKLQAVGVIIDGSHGKGGHKMLSFQGKKTTMPYHSADLGNVLIGKICRQLGLDPRKVLK